MVSCKLMGGWANQSIQICAAYALAHRNADIAAFDFDSCYTPLQGQKSLRYRNNIFQKVNRIYTFKFDNYYSEPEFTFREIPYQKNLLLSGYFQSPSYWREAEQAIKDLFVIEKLPINYNFTTIHIRRGDFLLNPQIFLLPPLSYYHEAMEKIGGDFRVVSDDLTWCKENLKGPGISYSQCDNEIDDISLMVYAKNNIIANSTFSLFSAWLNPNPDKIVYSPHWTQWFGPDGPCAKDVIPKEFIQIKY